VEFPYSDNIQDWTAETVSEWLAHCGFEREMAALFKENGIKSGKQIVSITDRFYEAPQHPDGGATSNGLVPFHRPLFSRRGFSATTHRVMCHGPDQYLERYYGSLGLLQ